MTAQTPCWCKGHRDCPDLDRDDDLGVLDLDDMPPTPRAIEHLQIAAKVLDSDPPPIYTVSVNDYRMHLQGKESDGLRKWADSRWWLTGSDVVRIDDDGTHWRVWVGSIEGVPVRVDCEVTA